MGWLWWLALACGGPAPVTPPAPPPPPAPVVPPPPPATPPPAPPPPPAPVVDPGTLPQTRDRPAPDDPAFLARAQLVVDAVAGGDPAGAAPAFFPLSAYLQVKDLPKPEQDWRTRLFGAYETDLVAQHGTLGGGPATLLRVEIPERRVTWIEPGREYNKLGYWRVLGATLVWEVDGKERRLPVRTMISWRGQWYVVHITTP